jgi:hypothetical protein
MARLVFTQTTRQQLREIREHIARDSPSTAKSGTRKRMRWPMKKVDVIKLMRDIPDDAEIDIDKLMYALYLRRKIEIAEADAEAGRDISQEEFERLTDEWLK